MGYLGKFTQTLGRRRQRIYSINNMENIEYRYAAMIRNERKKNDDEINKKWLLDFIHELKATFEENQEVVSTLENNVFSKWAEHNFKRTAYLAPVDVYNALADFPDAMQIKAKEVGESIRACIKHEVYKKD